MSAPIRSDAWPDETIARLRVLWDEGHPSAEIGRCLGFTKNAVLGKAKRLHLPMRNPPTKGAERKPLKPGVKIPPAGPVTLPALESAAIKLPLFEAAAKKPQKTPPPNWRCEWLDGDRPFVRCRASAHAGRPYCGPHAHRAYVNYQGPRYAA